MECIDNDAIVGLGILTLGLVALFVFGLVGVAAATAAIYRGRLSYLEKENDELIEQLKAK